MKHTILAILLTATLIPSMAFAECDAQNVAVTKYGFYGAVNTDIYETMDNALRSKDNVTITNLLKDQAIEEVAKLYKQSSFSTSSKNKPFIINSFIFKKCLENEFYNSLYS